ncbi:ATP-grasp domain-containing protein [Paenibacillus donghaensis]|uniref:Carbamoyl-phosphate synthase large subunit n=1 Tax=Paenibacillus donghaensis TaxID=414771 RepID=A0A2Z2KTQ6_9BACL|nr:ATP-grasp domain-containing protein [Paenibacillus donghaensis]ASA25282.1 carbamoyl-phosphate synthase large subunit [Paenibacillus donghaensis]
MKKVNIYFNRWFSVAFHYMNLIRNNEDGIPFQIFATHPDIRHMSLQGADVAETEPALQGIEYVQFCVEFCRAHEIDIFIPRLHMLDIALHAQLFDEIETKVLVCRDLDLLETIMDKGKFYESVSSKGLMTIPDYHVVSNVQQFRAAYEDLVARGHRVCFKPTETEGGLGFRIIDNARSPLEELFGHVTPLISFEEASRILGSTESFPDLMVMELLEGYEYSIDCLADEQGKLLAVVPRRKAGGRLRLMEHIPELEKIAASVAEAYRIPFNYNIQMKYSGSIPKLLEINPRMSGGLHISCLSGINFPYLAVKSALGGEVQPAAFVHDVLASHVEQPLIMRIDGQSVVSDPVN